MLRSTLTALTVFALTHSATSLSQDPPLLRGPDTARPSLVRFDFEGNFIVIQDRPELAAVALLDDLTRSELARQAASKRIGAIARLLADQVGILRDATDAIRAGDSARAQTLQRQLYDLFEPNHDRDPLLPTLKDHLTPDQLDRVRALLDEYWNAWIAWELRTRRDAMEGAAGVDTRWQAQEALSYRQFQREMNEAYLIAIQPVAQRLERIYAAVQPTAEQRAAIREVMLQYIRETQVEPTDEARRRATEGIDAILTDDQRRMLLSYVMWGQ